LIGIPWRVAFALQADGWYSASGHHLAQAEPDARERARPLHQGHEYIFLLSKSERYYFDSEAMQEPAIHAGKTVKTNGSERHG
jgi:hypothetical protein